MVNQRLLDAAREATRTALGDARFQALLDEGAITEWDELPVASLAG